MVKHYAVSLLRLSKSEAALHSLQSGLSETGARLQCIEEPIDLAALSDRLALIVVDASQLTFALRAVQRLRGTRPRLPVIAVTVDVDEAGIHALTIAGACDFVRVPFDPVELRLRARRAIIFGRHAAAVQGRGIEEQISMAMNASAERSINVAFDCGRDLLDHLMPTVNVMRGKRTPPPRSH